jgi:tape measure domain-containing protein
MTEALNVGAIEYIASIDLQQFVRDQRRLSRGLNEVEQDADRFAGSMTKIALAVQALGAALAVVKAARLADEFRTLAARVDVVAGSVEAGASAFQALNDISTRTQTAVADNVSLFTRLNAAVKQLGGTQDDTLRVTELVSKAIKVSGANAQEAAAAQLQFAQALGSGKLQGDELRSLLETSPYLMQRLADSMGVPVSALRKLGEEGKLTSDKVLLALGDAASKIEQDFQRMPATIEGAMTVARDSASRAALEFDKLTGGSTVLTGAIRGLGDVVDRLAVQFGAATDKSDALAKNDAVQSWARDVRTGLSYVVDVADVLWQTLSVLGRNVAFVFKGIGSEIGGIGAQIAAVARGDFAAARAIHEEMVADAEQRRRDLDAADQKTLARAKTFGEQMRDAWAKADAGGLNGGTRGGRGVTGADVRVTGRISSSSTDDDAKKRFKFDADAYLQSLREANSKGLELVDERMRGELDKAKRLLDEKKIGILQYEVARTEIEAKAQADREKIYQQDQDAALHAAEVKRKLIEEQGRLQAEAAAEAQKNDAQKLIDETLGKGDDPVAKLLAENDAKLQAVQSYEDQRLLTEQQASALRVALMQQEQEKLAAIEQQRQQQQAAVLAAQLQNYGNLFGGIADLTKTFAGEQSGVYKAMFAVSKAFAIADSIIKIQQGIANALSLPFPANIAAAAATAAQAAGIVSTIQGTNFSGGRQYGGPVNAGSLYRVNETGKPEMFTASSGAQYMLPTANGKVTAADKVGGSGQAPTVIIQNMGTPQQVQSQTYDSQSNTLKLITADLVDQFSNNSGPVYNAAVANTNLRGRL